MPLMRGSAVQDLSRESMCTSRTESTAFSGRSHTGHLCSLGGLEAESRHLASHSERQFDMAVVGSCCRTISNMLQGSICRASALAFFWDNDQPR